MDKLGIFYAYWTKNWSVNLSELTNYVYRADDLGFDVLELHSDIVLNMSQQDQEKLRRIAEEKNIDLTFCGTLTDEHDISSEDNNTREKGIEYLRESIRMIHNMGGETFSGVISGAWNPSFEAERLNKPSYFERSVNSMKEVIKTAEELDVYCNVEVVNRFEQFLLNTCKEAVNYVNRVGSPNLKIHLDTYHMNIEEDSLREAIIMAGDKLGHFHAGENNRKPPGQGGHIPWDEVIKALKEINYTGYIVMEPFLQLGGDVASDVKLWRDLRKGKNLDEEAKKALNFLRGKLNIKGSS